MLNAIWAVMVLAGILYAAVSGNLGAVGIGVLEAAREAIALLLGMMGAIGVWNGLMEIAREAGIIAKLTDWMRPVLRWLFPQIPGDHPAQGYMAANLIANLLGLGGAATPAGLLAMRELSKLETGERASDAMCTLLVLNVSSLQLLPVTIIAFRSQYGSGDPTAIVGPGLVATAVSTGVGILFCKIATGRSAA